MICPYCQTEMILGYLTNGTQPVQWIPEGKKESLLSFSVADEGVALPSRFTMRGYRAKAYYCPNCKIVIAKTE